MCDDYRALIEVIQKNKYSFLLVKNLIDTLPMASLFSHLELRLRYFQLNIIEVDALNTTCEIIYGSYEFLVMFFEHTNAPNNFCNFIKNVLYGNLDYFVVVYLEDILI